jgi:hypothetical protein
MGNQAKIIRLFQAAQQRRSESMTWRPVAATAGIALLVLLLVTWFFMVKLGKAHISAARAIDDSKKYSEVISTLQAENEWFRAEAEHSRQVRFLERDLRLGDVELSGSGVTGYVQNYGTNAFGDIQLTAMLKTADGTFHEKTVTVKSSDGSPLGRWQRRPFRIVLDMDPGPDANATVFIKDVQVIQ